MKFTFFHNTPPWYRLLLTVFFVFTLMIITYIIAILIGIPLFHLSFKELSGLDSPGFQSENIQFMKYIQAVQSIGAFLLPSLLLAWLFSGVTKQYLYINKNLSFTGIFLVSFSLVAAIPVINFTGHLNSNIPLPGFLDEFFQKMEESYSELLTSFLNTSSIGGYMVNLFIIAILPAICEEFLFRGVFQRIFSDLTHSKHFGIIMAAALFSMFHVHFSGLIPRFLLGVYFGYLLVWSKTIWLPVIAHFVNNAFAVTFYHFSGATPGDSTVDTMGSNIYNPLPLIISVVFFTLLVFSVYQTERLRQLKL